MARNCHFRLLDNNFNNTDVATITYSSQLSSTFGAANTRTDKRSEYWKPSGNFEVTTSNQSIYISDGSLKTATLTVGSYATPALMAAQVQTALNAVSSSWTCTWSSSTNRFTIGRTGTAVLHFNTTTNAAWDMLGFTATAAANISSSTYTAEEPRIHTSEWYQLDLGLPYPAPAFCAVCPITEAFQLTGATSIKIMADNVDANWSAPIFSATITATDRGIFSFHDVDGATMTFRYWRFQFVDRQNTAGPSTFKFSHLYFGDYVTSTLSNIATGIEIADEDPSDELVTDSGQQFYNTKPKVRRFSSLSIENMDATARRELQRAFLRMGRTTIGYLAIDPTVEISASTDELTIFGRFARDPTLSHVIRDLYTVSMEFREAV